MIQKIYNLDTEISEDQLEIEWAKLISTKNKLLEISDWTQLSDVFLPADVKKEWGEWRQKLRKVNRKTFADIEQAGNVIEFLKKEMPKNTTLDEAAFTENFSNTSISPEKIVQKTIIKEQPIIFKEEMEMDRFINLFKETLEKDSYYFRDYLLSFLDPSNTNIFIDGEELDVCKDKTKDFIKTQRTHTLNKKLKSFVDLRIMQQRTEEAVEYLSEKSPILDNYPLIKLHSEESVMTPEDSALNFLRDKRWYNQLLLESEKFIFYTNKMIDKAENINQLRAIIESYKNGY